VQFIQKARRGRRCGRVKTAKGFCSLLRQHSDRKGTGTRAGRTTGFGKVPANRPPLESQLLSPVDPVVQRLEIALYHLFSLMVVAKDKC
jgi:hypothetical protein